MIYNEIKLKKKKKKIKFSKLFLLKLINRVWSIVTSDKFTTGIYINRQLNTISPSRESCWIILRSPSRSRVTESPITQQQFRERVKPFYDILIRQIGVVRKFASLPRSGPSRYPPLERPRGQWYSLAMRWWYLRAGPPLVLEGIPRRAIDDEICTP